MMSHSIARLLARPRFKALITIAWLAASTTAHAQEWYDHYERGMAALKRRQPILAAASFQRAAQRQPTPGQNMVTYGTNRIAEYYPYVRLAEALAMAGDVELARRALERSETSGKEPAAMRAVVVRMLEDAQRATPPPPSSTEPAPSAAVVPVPQPASSTPAPTPLPAPATASPLPAVVPALAPPPVAASSTPAPLAPQAAPTAETRVATSAPASRDPLPERTATPAKTEPDRGSIDVVTTPGNADVYLDDEFIGRSSGNGLLVRRDVPPGRHVIRAANVSGFDEARAPFDLGPGETRTIPVSLTARTAPETSPGAVALMVAGLVIACVLAIWAIRSRARSKAREAAFHMAPTVSSQPERATPAPVTPGGGAIATSLEPTRGIARDTFAESPTQPLGTDPAREGSQFGDYKLVRELGRGGMAVVFLAEKNGEHVALKRPLASYLAETEFLERFMREAEIGRTLNHPNIVHILDKGRIGAIPYFTMELVSGETLQALAKREGPLPARRAAQIVKQVAEALDYAHLKGVIHRDLKPSNIMILEGGVAKVMDYGIARSARFEGLTVTGAFLGTPEYVAPETAEGGTTDARSDLYALGVILYELVTGLRPFVGDTPFATLKKHCTEPPRPPSQVKNTPPAIEAIILKLLRKNPADRYPGAEELIIELNAYLDSGAT